MKDTKILQQRPGRVWSSLGAGRDGFLFSVTGQAEGFCQMQGGVVQRQVMHGSPKVEHVAVSAATGVEALENVLAQIGRERRRAGILTFQASIPWRRPR